MLPHFDPVLSSPRASDMDDDTTHGFGSHNIHNDSGHDVRRTRSRTSNTNDIFDLYHQISGRVSLHNDIGDADRTFGLVSNANDLTGDTNPHKCTSTTLRHKLEQVGAHKSLDKITTQLEEEHNKRTLVNIENPLRKDAKTVPLNVQAQANAGIASRATLIHSTSHVDGAVAGNMQEDLVEENELDAYEMMEEGDLIDGYIASDEDEDEDEQEEEEKNEQKNWLIPGYRQVIGNEDPSMEEFLVEKNAVAKRVHALGMIEERSDEDEEVAGDNDEEKDENKGTRLPKSPHINSKKHSTNRRGPNTSSSPKGNGHSSSSSPDSSVSTSDLSDKEDAAF